MQNNKIINLVYACDANYIQFFFISAYSVLLHNDRNNVHFHLFYDGSDDDLELLRCKAGFDAKLSIYFPNNDDFADVKVNRNIPVSAYFRLLIPRFLPDVERILYLDCDTIVCSSLAGIFNIDLMNNALAAVSDAGISLKIKRKLGCSKYFNSGVLLIDTVRFSQLIDECFTVLGNHDLITFHDQCVLNYVFKNSWLELDKRWNYMSNNFVDKNLVLLDFNILHFNSIFGKPWEKGCNHPFKSHYLFIKSLTIYKYDKLTNPRLVVLFRNKFPTLDLALKKLRGYQ